MGDHLAVCIKKRGQLSLPPSAVSIDRINVHWSVGVEVDRIGVDHRASSPQPCPSLIPTPGGAWHGKNHARLSVAKLRRRTSHQRPQGPVGESTELADAAIDFSSTPAVGDDQSVIPGASDAHGSVASGKPGDPRLPATSRASPLHRQFAGFRIRHHNGQENSQQRQKSIHLPQPFPATPASHPPIVPRALVDHVGVLLVWTTLLRFQGPIFGKKNEDWEIFFAWQFLVRLR